MKIKLYTIIFGLVLLVLGSVSCERSYLYPWPPDGARTPEDVWGNYDFTKGFLDAVSADNMTSYLYSDVSGGGMLASASDEAQHSNPSGVVRYFTNGVWGPTNVPTLRYGGPWASSSYLTPWANDYAAIRRLNLFLENVDNSVLIDDPSDPSKANERTNHKGFAHFLRAWFQFDLFCKYGCFPIVSKSLSIAEDNLFIPKNTLQECYNAILEDCDQAIRMLPELWDDSNWGKANKSAARALKSRLTLYFASPLYQGEFESFGLAANTTGDVERWKEAIKAAREMINENTFYSLMPVTKFTRPYSAQGTYCHQVGLQVNLNQNEAIWGSSASSNGVYDEMYNMPAGVEGCYGYTNPTQEMVDAFEVVSDFNTPNAKASDFDWSNPEHAKNPYANRDPRFYASIMYNGLLWGNDNSMAFTIDTYEGGIHKDPLNPNSTKTGYYFRKFLTENFYAYKTDWYVKATRSRILFRLAEIILNYAEAMNEVYGPEAADPEGGLKFGPKTALEAVNMIRERVKMPAIPSGLSQEQFREKIKHERRVELCFEGHRMYDLRRWKEGEKLGGTIHGIKITPSGTGTDERPAGYTYTVTEVEKRVWRDCMYWWPIPYSEIVKFEGKLIQNPGWDTK